MNVCVLPVKITHRELMFRCANYCALCVDDVDCFNILVALVHEHERAICNVQVCISFQFRYINGNMFQRVCACTVCIATYVKTILHKSHCLKRLFEYLKGIPCVLNSLNASTKSKHRCVFNRRVFRRKKKSDDFQTTKYIIMHYVPICAAWFIVKTKLLLT